MTQLNVHNTEAHLGWRTRERTLAFSTSLKESGHSFVLPMACLIFSTAYVLVYFQLDMSAFEEAFKTRAQDSDADRARLLKIAEAQQKRGTSIIDVTRARNLCKLLFVLVKPTFKKI